LRDVYGFLEPLAGADHYVGLRRWIAALDEPAVIRDELAVASHQEAIDRELPFQRRAPGEQLIAFAVGILDFERDEKPVAEPIAGLSGERGYEGLVVHFRCPFIVDRASDGEILGGTRLGEIGNQDADDSPNAACRVCLHGYSSFVSHPKWGVRGQELSRWRKKGASVSAQLEFEAAMSATDRRGPY
jgi:hypothetical protein